MHRTVSIGGHRVGLGHPPMVVAELSGNHNGSLERALSLVEAAAASGAHAVKLQTYTAETMTLDSSSEGFVIDDPVSPWYGERLYDLYQRAATPWAWHRPIFDHCRRLGLIAFSSPFDAAAVDFLETLDAPCYKIASFELVDLPLIRYAAATGKPLILSTGMATRDEIDEAVTAAREAGARDLVLLHCTSAYPASPMEADLRTLPFLRERFDCEVGLSDHTHGIGVAVAAVALGATLVEKHLTLRRSDGGVDAAFSMEPAEMQRLVSESERAWQALGSERMEPTASEQDSRRRRRSLYVVEDLAAGSELTTTNVRAIRPGLGLAPKHLDACLGQRVVRDVARGTPLDWALLGQEQN